MSLIERNCQLASKQEAAGFKASMVENFMQAASDDISARHVRKEKTRLIDALNDFETAHGAILAVSDKLIAASDDLSKRTKVSVARAKDQAQQMADAMLKITKTLGADFEARLLQMERLADALERLNELEQKGVLSGVIEAISKKGA